MTVPGFQASATVVIARSNENTRIKSNLSLLSGVEKCAVFRIVILQLYLRAHDFQTMKVYEMGWDTSWALKHSFNITNDFSSTKTDYRVRQDKLTQVRTQILHECWRASTNTNYEKKDEVCLL